MTEPVKLLTREEMDAIKAKSGEILSRARMPTPADFAAAERKDAEEMARLKMSLAAIVAVIAVAIIGILVAFDRAVHNVVHPILKSGIHNLDQFGKKIDDVEEKARRDAIEKTEEADRQKNSR